MKRRLLSMLLVLATILTLLPVQALAAGIASPVDTANPFQDVKEDSWYYEAVQYVRINGFFYGTSKTTFEPDTAMTRGMFVTVLGRMAGVDAEAYTGEPAFSDVERGAYYAPYVAWASRYGVTAGTGDGMFSPDAYISRQQMATFFARYFEIFGVDYETEADITTTPADIDSVAEWARDAVLDLWRTGLLNGDGVNFNPEENADRAQAAMICYRADQAVDIWYSEPGVPSGRVKIDPATGLPYDESDEPVDSGDDEGFGPSIDSYSVSFYDGSRLIESFTAYDGEPLGMVPSVIKSSKAGYILEGYYTDPDFTAPFYAEDPVTGDMNVYARYESMGDAETLTIDSFARMDQDRNVSFTIKQISGSVRPGNAATLVIKDGSDPVEIAVVDNGDGTYTVYAPAGFNEGCSYELNLADGWVFVNPDQPEVDTIRTAAFSIEMAQVEDLSMSDGIRYIRDTDQISYTYKDKDNQSHNVEVLPSDADFTRGGSFEYGNAGDLRENDILCIHVNGKPDSDEERDPMDPAVYAKVSSVSGSTVNFVPLEESDQTRLYDIPDNFPLTVPELPAEDTGTVNISALDTALYAQMVGADKGTADSAMAALSIGDFVSLYVDSADVASEEDVYFGSITGYDPDTGTISFTRCTAGDIEESANLYKDVDIENTDLITPEEQAYIEQVVQAQVDQSGFAEEAAYLLADMATQTQGFRDSLGLLSFTATGEDGEALSDEELASYAGIMELDDDDDGDDDDDEAVEVKVSVILDKDRLHFGSKGVQLAVEVSAKFKVDGKDDGTIHFDLSATFIQEIAVDPKVKGELVYKKILDCIPVPTGVQVNAIVDVKSYTAMSLKADIYTVAAEDKPLWEKFKDFANDPTALADIPGVPEELTSGLKSISDALDKIEELKDKIAKALETEEQLEGYAEDIQLLWSVIQGTNPDYNEEEWTELCRALGKTNVAEELMDMLHLTEDEISADYISSLSDLMDRYSEMLERETDWVQLVDAQMFDQSTPPYYGVIVGVEGSFVVRADVNITLGTNLEYEVGKRYNFWFRVGLFQPTSGSSTMDLIDERFAFQFYVMGKLGIKTGVRLKLYAALGNVDAVSVGLTTELGPYVKLWGFFIYDYSKYRPANTQNWAAKEQMAGALYLEFGLYLMVGMEAKALFLEFDRDFLDEEFPLLDAGGKKYYYDTAYEPLDEDDEIVIYNDNSTPLQPDCAVSMLLPREAYALRYIDLTTGAQGAGSLSFDNYNFKVSNPNFRVDNVDGKPVVSVISLPQNVRLMKCDLTVTYRHGKLAFSTFDMSTTVHLVWTNLTPEEYQQVYTASVVIPDGNGGREAVWSKRVRKGTPFDLPTEEELHKLLSWSDAKYIAGAGYGSQPTEGVTLIQSTMYDYDLDYQSYALTVNGIEGGADTQTFTARYGEPFDFSALLNTGTEDPGVSYTRFAGLTMNGQNLDLNRPVTGSFAESVRASANAVATAEYVDDSVTATFTFSGMDHKDISVTLRRGGTPDTAEVFAAVPSYLAITGFYPQVGPLESDITYQVVCEAPKGASVVITFNSNGGSEVEPVSRVPGSVLGTLPTPTRTGYTFDGWFTDDETFENPVDANTVVTGAMTLYAKWTAVSVTVTFDPNGGMNLGESTKTVVYDQPYGELPTAQRNDLDANYAFTGWFTEMDGGEEVTAETVVNAAEDHTLYAHWLELKKIPADVFDFGEQEIVTYDRTGHPVEYTFTPEDGESYTEDSFTLIYAGTTSAGGSTEAPINAGTYKVIVTRPADERYDAFEAEYDDVLVIEKAIRDLSTAVIDVDNSICGFNYLSVGTSIDDLGQGAKVSFSMTTGGQQGISTNDVRCFFYGLSEDTDYTVSMTSLSVTNDPNYEDAAGTVDVSASFTTTSAPSDICDGDTSWYSSARSFTLTTAEQMFGFAKLIREGNDFKGKTVTLEADVDLSGYKWDTYGIAAGYGTFNGTFDGQGHKIYGLYVNMAGPWDLGMFRYLGGSARVERVLLAGGEVYGWGWASAKGVGGVGAIAGQIGPGACVSDCVSFAAVHASAGGADQCDVGGIVGKSDHGTVVNCVNYGSVSSNQQRVGGIVGYNVEKAQVANCANYGAVSGSMGYIGGIVGGNNDKASSIYNCVNAGTVTKTPGGWERYRGAIVGRNYDDEGYVDQCYYLAGSAPDRKAAGTYSGAASDTGKNRKCASFRSFTGAPDAVVEDGCSSSMTLIEVLNHWVNRCGPEYSVWTLSGPGGAPMPETAAWL